MNPVRFIGPEASCRYIAPHIGADLDRADPDVVMLGGFTIPGNYLAYRWAVRHRKRVIVYTERSRDGHGTLRKRGLAWRLLRWLYRNVEQVMVTADDAVEQFRDEFGFGEKVIAARYASDLDAYFAHPVRSPRPAYTLLFANRMTAIYNPIGAIDIFAEIAARHPGTRLLINADGELGPQCQDHVRQLGLENSVEFLTDLRSWSDLGDVYARADILILPATFSNGNFTILEAMASGMGLVISDKVMGIGTMVVEGENGFNCEPTQQAFVERIERYIADPDLFRRHTLINRPLVQPLSIEGTAQFLAGKIDPQGK